MSSNDDSAVFVTLGDGDFTFSLDFVRWLSERRKAPLVDTNEEELETSTKRGWNNNLQLFCTGLDDEVEFAKKYKDSAFTLKQLHRVDGITVSVVYNINAILPSPNQQQQNDNVSALIPPPADFLIFNHPHLATENAKLHSRFLAHLFHAVRQRWLKPDGLFCLTLSAGQYRNWDCLAAAKRHGFVLWRQTTFHAPGLVEHESYYELRRHQSGKSFANRVAGKSETMLFHHQKDDVKRSQKEKEWDRYMAWLIAPKEVTSTATIDGDKKRKTKKKQGSFPCPHCDRMFLELRSVQNHVLSKHGAKRKREEIFTCTLCDEHRQFKSREAYTDHLNAKHHGRHTTIKPDWYQAEKAVNQDPVYTCDICGCGMPLACSKEEAFQTHMDEFLPSDLRCIEVPSFQCSICGRKFQELRAQLQHENSCRKTTSVQL